MHVPRSVAGPVTVGPHAREPLEVGGSVPAPVGSAPETYGHRRQRWVSTNSPSWSTTGWPSSSKTSTAAPRHRHEISPAHTGWRGLGHHEPGADVCSSAERRRATGPLATSRYTHSAAAAGKGEPVDPGSSNWRSGRGLRRGRRRIQWRRPGSRPRTPPHVVPVSAMTSQRASGAGHAGRRRRSPRRIRRPNPGDAEVPHHPAGCRKPEEAVARVQCRNASPGPWRVRAGSHHGGGYRLWVARRARGVERRRGDDRTRRGRTPARPLAADESGPRRPACGGRSRSGSRYGTRPPGSGIGSPARTASALLRRSMRRSP